MSNKGWLIWALLYLQNHGKCNTILLKRACVKIFTAEPMMKYDDRISKWNFKTVCYDKAEPYGKTITQLSFSY